MCAPNIGKNCKNNQLLLCISHNLVTTETVIVTDFQSQFTRSQELLEKPNKAQPE